MRSTGGEEIMKISAGRPLSVEAVEFSPAPATEEQRQSGRKTMSSATGGSSPTEVVKLPLSKAGGGGGVRFVTAAEVHRPLSTDDEGTFLAQPSGQHVVRNTDPVKAPVMLSAPRGDKLVSEPEMHSAQMKALDGIPMEEVECLEPLLTSVPDAPLDSKPMAGNMIKNSSDFAVPQKYQTGRPTEGVTSPAPSRRSVMQLHLDSQPSGYKSMPDRPRYLISDDAPHRQARPPSNETETDVVIPNKTPGRNVCFYDNKTVSYGNKDNVVQTARSEFEEDPTSRSRSEPFVLKPVPDEIAEKRIQKLEERSLSERPWQNSTDRSAGIHGKPSGAGGSYRGGRDWIGGALVFDRVGTGR